MNTFYVAKGALYILLGAVFTPMVLERHPVMMGFQGAVFIGFGIAYIVKGVRA
jgi:hypothetical protein